MAGNYLTKSRHGTVFYFRRRVPATLQHVIGRNVILQSLQTCDRRLAIIRGRAFAAQTDAIFQRLIMTQKSGKSDNIRIDYELTIDLNELGLPSSIKVNAQPDEQEAVNSALRMALEGIGGRGSKVDSPKAQKRFVDAVSEYFEKAEVKQSSQDTFRARLAFAEKFFGSDSDVLAIDQGMFTEFCEHVRKAKTDNAIKTQNLYMENVAQFINWHLRRKFGGNAPTVSTFSLLLKDNEPDADKRAAFTLPQLRALFEKAKQYQTSSPCEFWATVAPVFTGCRIEELCQINLRTDIHHDDAEDIWYLKFDELPDEDGKVRKSIKKPSNWRVAPIHPVLVKHGFIEFLNAQKKAGYSRPFESRWKPLIKTNKTTGAKSVKWNHYPVRWGSDQIKKLRAAGFDAKLTYFQSQRHACKGILIRSGVSEEISEAIAGRRYGSSDAERYGKLKKDHVRLYKEGIAVGLKELSDMLDKVLGDDAALRGSW